MKLAQYSSHGLILLCLLLLNACGGGGGGSTAPNEAEASDLESGYSIHLALYNSTDNQPTSNVSADAPGELVIRVQQRENPVASALVSISTSLGSVDTQSGSVLTNTQGIANVDLLAGSVTGAGTVTASAVFEDGTSLQVNLNFNVSGSSSDEISASDIEISLTVISESGLSNIIRADDPGTATVVLLNDSGEPVTNEIVSFAGDGIVFNPTAGTALTNANGEASISVLSGNSTGIATVTASVVINGQSTSESLYVDVQPPAIEFGSIIDSVFVANTLSASSDLLSAGGTTTISAFVANDDNTGFETPISVSFTSLCAAEDRATIDASAFTVNGEVSVTYQASGCVGADQVTASFEFGGITYVASANIEIAGDSVGSISFVDADPTSIVLRGAGGQGLAEASSVSFQVLGSQGMPVANQQVNFSLTSTVGGITINPASGLSDANGIVSTTVQSGSIATSVVVIASIPDTNISTQSGILVVSTGVPDQDSMSLSMQKLNPEGWSFAGETVQVTAYAADFFNNPVPNGVSFSFTVESGQVGSSCTTEDGTCTVTWRSQNPRPADGIVTLMASTIGAESFGDENGNGIFDDGDSLGAYDLPEAFRDDNWNGVRDATEPFVDFNANGVFDSADSLYNGPICTDSSRCSTETGVSVRSSIQFVLSGSVAEFAFNHVDEDADDMYDNLDLIEVTLQDERGNSLPGDSDITITTSIGTLATPSTVKISNAATGPFTLGIRVNLNNVSPTTGFGAISVSVLTPNGVFSSDSFQFEY